MKLSVAVGVLLAPSSIEHATALSIHPRINSALSSTTLKQPTAPVTETDYNNSYNEDGFDVEYITSALLEPPSPLRLRQQTSLAHNNGLTAPNSDVAQFGHFGETEQQIDQQFNPLTRQQFVRHNDDKSFRAPNRLTQQPVPISNQQLTLRTNFDKQKVMTGRDRRNNWESYAAPGIPGRKTASNTGGVIGSPGGIGDWHYSSSYGPATTTYPTGTESSSQVSSMRTGKASFPSHSNGAAWNRNQANSKNYGTVMTGAERRSRFHSFHSFEPVAPEVDIDSRVSAGLLHEFDSKNQGGTVVGLGADRFANLNRAKPSVPAVEAQMARPAQELVGNNKSNLITGAAVDQPANNNDFPPLRNAGRNVQVNAVNGAGLDRSASLNSFEPRDFIREVQKDEQEVNGVAPHPRAARGTASFNGFNPTMPPRDAFTDSQREHVVTSRPLSTNGFKPISPKPQAEKSGREENALTSRLSPANNVGGIAQPNKFEPFLPTREAQMSRQGNAVTSPSSPAINVGGNAWPNKFDPFLSNRGAQTSRQGNADASPSNPASNVGGNARPNKFDPFLSNRGAQTSRQGNAVASPSGPASNVGGNARPNKFEPFVPNRESQGTHHGNAVASSPRSPDSVRETMKPNKFAPFVPTRGTQHDREQEDAASTQDLVSFLKNPRTAKKNAKDVAASLSAMSPNPTFYNDFAPSQVAEVPVRQEESYRNQSNDLNFVVSNGALQATPFASEVPMDTPARQSLPPYLSLCSIPGKGLGVITKKPIKIGEFIGNYEGEIMPEEVKDRRYLKSLQHKLTDEDREWIQSRLDRGQTITGSYLYGVDLDGGNIYKHFGRNRGSEDQPEEEHVSRIFVDAEDEYKSLWTRFINHASPPLDNLKPMSVPESYDGKPRVWFMAKRDIEVGEELCFDYGDDYWLEGDEVF